MRSTISNLKRAVAGLALLTVSGLWAQQDTVRDQFGTEYIPEVAGAVVDLAYLDSGSSQTATRQEGGIYLPAQTSGLSDEVLVGLLEGIVLVPTPGDVIPSGVPGVQGIWHDLDAFPNKVGNALNAYLGQPVSLSSLDSMVRDTIQAYRASDRPVVDVLVPEQDITSGVVQLVVVEGRLETVRVQGAADEKTEAYLKNMVSTQKGDVISQRRMLGDLAWMNRSPYRRVDLVYAPGFGYGTTDVILRTNEFDPFSAYIGYENSGNELLGEDRLIFGFTWAEAFGPDRTLSYQGTTDLEFDNIEAHSLIYGTPLPWRHYFTFLGSYVQSDASIPVGGDPLEVGGESWQLTGRYAIPIRRAPENMTHEWELGMDFKSSNSNLEFGDSTFFDSTTHIYQFSLGYNLLAQGNSGTTRVDLTGFWSPGEVDPNNDTETFSESRAGAVADYFYATASVERSQRVIENWLTARLRAQGQISTENLLASEQFGVGGPGTIRGFPTSVARGDEGVLVSAEFYGPRYSLADWFDWRGTSDELRMLLFADYAQVSNVNLLPGELGTQELFSVGAGIRWTYDDFLRVKVDFGIPISHTLVDDDIVEGFRIHIGATATF